MPLQQVQQRTDPALLVEKLRAALDNRTPAAEASDGARPAGVLVPLQYHDDAWHVILNVRSEHVGQHRGEIAFPGGRLEPEDVDMTACALRETWEEMRIRPEDVEVLGPMDARLTRTNFLVWPTVGIVPYPYDFVPDPREVAEIVEVPLDVIVDGSSALHEARLLSDGTLLRRTSFSHNGYLVFGATAWILEDLVQIIAGAGLTPADLSQRRTDQETIK